MNLFLYKLQHRIIYHFFNSNKKKTDLVTASKDRSVGVLRLGAPNHGFTEYSELTWGEPPWGKLNYTRYWEVRKLRFTSAFPFCAPSCRVGLLSRHCVKGSVLWPFQRFASESEFFLWLLGPVLGMFPGANHNCRGKVQVYFTFSFLH